MSELRADTITASDGTSPVTLTKQSAAKAWVKFKTSTATTINDSFNVDSLTDIGSGNTQVNFSNSMSDSNYCVLALCQFQNNAGQTIMEGPSDVTSSKYELYSKTNSNAVIDTDINSSAVHGDLA